MIFLLDSNTIICKNCNFLHKFNFSKNIPFSSLIFSYGTLFTLISKIFFIILFSVVLIITIKKVNLYSTERQAAKIITIIFLLILIILTIIFIYFFLKKIKTQLPAEYLWIEDKSYILTDNNNNEIQIQNSENIISRQNLISQNNENKNNNNNLNLNSASRNQNHLRVRNNINNNMSCNISYHHNNSNNINNKINFQYKKLKDYEKNYINKYFYYNKHFFNMDTLDVFENQNKFMEKTYLIEENKMEKIGLIKELNSDEYKEKILAKYRMESLSFINLETLNKNNFKTLTDKKNSLVDNKDLYNDSSNDFFNKEISNYKSYYENQNKNENISKENSVENSKNLIDDSYGENKLTLNENKNNNNNSNNFIRKKPLSKFSSENISYISHESGSGRVEKVRSGNGPNWLESIKDKLSSKNIINNSFNGEEKNKYKLFNPQKKISNGTNLIKIFNIF